MSDHKTVVWFGDDPQPNTFFFRSPFRSWKFLTNTAIVTALFVAFGIVVLFAHWQGLTGASRRLFWGGYCLVVGSGRGMSAMITSTVIFEFITGSSAGYAPNKRNPMSAAKRRVVLSSSST